MINSLLFHALRREGGGGLSAWVGKAAVGRGKLLVAFVLGATHAPANYLPCANVVSTRVAPAVSRPAALLAVTLCACHRACMLNRCDVVCVYVLSASARLFVSVCVCVCLCVCLLVCYAGGVTRLGVLRTCLWTSRLDTLCTSDTVGAHRHR